VRHVESPLSWVRSSECAGRLLHPAAWGMSVSVASSSTPTPGSVLGDEPRASPSAPRLGSIRDMKQVAGYGQFCPVAMAAEVLCTRWTVLVLREMYAGSTRFNELRRGVPLMSPTLLSKRLKELENFGVIERAATAEPGVFEYRLTAAGHDLRSIVMGLGV